MRKEASSKEWKELYDLGVKIKELKPWQYFWDMDLITILLPEYDEPFYCSIMGKGGECFAIAVYYGVAINGFLRIVSNKNIPANQLVRYQDNNICYFANREELGPQEIKLIKKLGLKFRGRNEWIYFHSFEPGYLPYLLDIYEVQRMTEVFRQLHLTLVFFIEEKMKVGFENGQTLFRFFDDGEQSWQTSEAQLMLPRVDYNIIEVKNDILFAKLNKMPKTKNIIELDLVFLNSVINDQKFKKPLLAQVLIIADKITGMILSHDIIHPEDNQGEKIITELINYILKEGRPRVVYVRDEEYKTMLLDFAEKTGIELRASERLMAIDKAVNEFYADNF